jgi:protein-L-isoaspartate(D-aspartate) O-methyltransferase
MIDRPEAKTMKRLIFLWIILVCLMLSWSEAATDKEDFSRQREQMVRTQIEARGVKDSRVLNAMLKVERHLFVPAKHRHLAYGDFPLPIGEGQTISQPYIVALMSEALDLGEGDKVLEIGTGCGYQAAVLAELAREVYSVEIIKSLAIKAESLLGQLGYKNVQVRYGDGYLGWKEAAPFNAIIITCASDKIPEPLFGQLADGGRMIMPLGGRWGQELVLIKKRGEVLQKTSLGGCIFVPMTRRK